MTLRKGKNLTDEINEQRRRRAQALHDLNRDATKITLEQDPDSRRVDQMAKEGQLAAQMHAILTGLDEDDEQAFYSDAIASILHAARKAGFEPDKVISSALYHFAPEDAAQRLLLATRTHMAPDAVNSEEYDPALEVRTLIVDVRTNGAVKDHPHAAALLKEAYHAIPDMDKAKNLVLRAIDDLGVFEESVLESEVQSSLGM